ncbi:glutathione S-transferase family protein [Oceanicoccus sagamiensis]|uniref:Glutathione-dependent dehydroascorbate reductase n=1 Tax=Oceanicoccus sagamiensis TaxID=716816 RepID=A0A1X9NCY5_9GAMM|nr:glutathione S-transferase family protein [Oceanicoccus sagamiensis]ARN73389.1 hypothetical protein BST96_04245 [Oceanicoccus sagamiensis]
MAASIQLYSNDGCPYAQRTRIALLEKGLDFDFAEVDLANKPDWFVEASPSGKVPVLVHDGHRLFESAIINEYIDEVWPQPALMPADAVLRAQARIWVDKFSAFASTLFYIGVKKDQQELQQLTEKLKAELQTIEDNGFAVFSGEGPYWFGQQLSLVDINFYTFFERMPMVEQKVGINLAAYPLISRWYQAMSDRESVKATARTAEQHIESFNRLSDRLAARL